MTKAETENMSWKESTVRLGKLEDVKIHEIEKTTLQFLDNISIALNTALLVKTSKYYRLQPMSSTNIPIDAMSSFNVKQLTYKIPSCIACFSNSTIFRSEALRYLSNSLSFSSLSLSINGSENCNNKLIYTLVLGDVEVLSYLVD